VAGSAREAARETASTVQEQASRLRERAHVQVRDAKIGFWQKLDQDPLVVGAAIVAVGLVAGLLVPSTRREDEVLGDKRDDLLNRAQEKGRDVFEKGKHVAQTAVETLKTEAEQQGLSPQNIVDKVRTIGRDTIEQVKSQAEQQGLTPQAVAEKVKTIGRDTLDQAKSDAQREGLIPESGHTGGSTGSAGSTGSSSEAGSSFASTSVTGAAGSTSGTISTSSPTSSRSRSDKSGSGNGGSGSTSGRG